MSLTLYRGITVKPEEAEAIREQILARGIVAEDSGTWKIECIDLRAKLEKLRTKPDLCRDDTQPSRWIKTAKGGHRELIGSYPAICACADELGASYYALRHNYAESLGRTSPLLIKFTSEIGDIQIDGVDFLCHAFQLARTEAQTEMLSSIFGPRIRLYLDQAQTQERHEYEYRTSLCDLAVQDPEIIAAHTRNRTVIGGRGRNVFTSAFLVRSPLAAEKVISVSQPAQMEFKPDITLAEFKEM